jgi:hypothetical protein
MGVLDPFRRFFRRMAESDEQRYAEEILAWAQKVPGSVRIAEAQPRSHVKFAGVVRRITVRPLEGHESLEAILFDGTGEVTVMWMGRRAIRGLTLGTAPDRRGPAGRAAFGAPARQPDVRVRRLTAERRPPNGRSSGG